MALGATADPTQWSLFRSKAECDSVCAATPGWRSWAFDLGCKPGGTNQPKSFVATSAEVFFGAYARMVPLHRHAYEIVQGPCNLYFDLEGEGPLRDDGELQAVKIAAAACAMLAELAATQDVRVTVEVVTIDSAHADKFSRHLRAAHGVGRRRRADPAVWVARCRPGRGARGRARRQGYGGDHRRRRVQRRALPSPARLGQAGRQARGTGVGCLRTKVPGMHLHQLRNSLNSLKRPDQENNGSTLYKQTTANDECPLASWPRRAGCGRADRPANAASVSATAHISQSRRIGGPVRPSFAFDASGKGHGLRSGGWSMGTNR